MPRVTIPPYEFYYQWGSRAEDAVASDRNWGERPVLLFLHGFMGSGEDFNPVVQRLGDRYRCLMVDLPGHGTTEVRGDETAYAMPNTGAGLIGLLDQLHVQRCTVVGYSMGGRVALYLALTYPARVAAAVLESASPGLPTPQERQARVQQDEQLAIALDTGDFDAFLARWYRVPLFASLTHHSDFATVLQRRRANRPAELAKSLRQLGTGRQPSLWPCLHQCSTPLLLLVGEHDAKFCAINQAMAQQCPSATLTVVPNCGHTIHLEDPDAVTLVLNKFNACFS